MDSEFPRVTVQGDKDGGWIVEVHDGTNCATYSPVADNADEARRAGCLQHAVDFYPEVTQATGNAVDGNSPPLAAAPPSSDDANRLPTLEEWLAAGYAADAYPPQPPQPGPSGDTGQSADASPPQASGPATENASKD